MRKIEFVITNFILSSGMLLSQRPQLSVRGFRLLTLCDVLIYIQVLININMCNEFNTHATETVQ